MSKQKTFVVIPLLAICGTLLAACEPQGGNDGDVYNLTAWINEGNMFEDRTKDSVLKKIEEECNITLEVTGATHNNNYYTTLNPIINTGSPADLVFIVPSGCDPYTNWVEQGLFYDFDELIAEKPGEYPYLEKLLHCDQFKNIQFADENGDGMHTMMPFITSKNAWTIYYRADWLINIGYYTEVEGKKVARTPVTMDEFQDVLKKFTLNDPDGNGKNDTFGLSPASKATWFSPLFHAFGCTTDYDIDDNGNVIYQYLQPEYKNFLNWAQEMTAAGYIDEQFVSNTNSNEDRDKFYNGKSGILITNGEAHVQWVIKGVENIHGVGSAVVGPAPIGTATVGKEGCGGFSDWGGWWGGFSLMQSCKDPHAAMRFLNYINSPEGIELFHNGIEGIHYNKVGGEVVPDIDARFEEPTETFKVIQDENGENVPAGMHQLGSHFQAYYSWNQDGTFTFKPDNTSIPYQYREYFDQTVELNTLVSSKLTNMTCYPSSYAKMMKDMEDELNTYSIKCIAGQKNTTTDYDALMEKIGTNWTKIQKMIKEVARDCGII